VYRVHSRIGLSAFSIVVETAREVLTKMAELNEDGHWEIVVKDLLNREIDIEAIKQIADREVARASDRADTGKFLR
jgi:hypothetical protein